MTYYYSAEYAAIHAEFVRQITARRIATYGLSPRRAKITPKTTAMRFVLNDGGRAAAGYKGETGDCCARSVAIVTGLPYREVYDAINATARGERTGKRKRGVSSARTGV